MQFVEKYIDMRDPGANYDINRCLANGWFIFFEGLTLCILRKYI